MSYTIELEKSAERHYLAGEHLGSCPRHKAIAGYLYGIAAECAIKHMMQQSNIRPLPDRRQDPFYAHFPELKGLLSNLIQGRGAAQFQRFLCDDFMQEWDVKMRYAPDKDIDQRKVDKWRNHANNALNAMRSF